MAVVSDVLTGGYAEAKRRARANDPRALDEVARQFEAYFVQQMLKGMRQASLGDPLFDSSAGKLYRELLDQRLSLQVASGRGLGLAKTLAGQIRRYALGSPPATTPPASPTRTAPASPSAPRARVAPEAIRQRERPEAAFVPIEPSPVVRGDRAGAGGARGSSQGFSRAEASGRASPPALETGAPASSDPPLASDSLSFSSREDFVQRLRPQAERAARRLGVAPEVLLAQSALETGWGRDVPRVRPGGQSSHNFFGIKADRRWRGERAVRTTLEFDQGVMKRVPAAFRAYDDATASFDDYAKLILSSPRYRAALEHAGDPSAFLAGLKAGGYATDPDYTAKIMAILERAPFERFVPGQGSAGA